MTTTAGYLPSLDLNEERAFTPLRLEPVARTGTYESLASSINLTTTSDTQLATPLPKYPRIIVRDHLGRTLDTFTSLQEAIYRANWARKKLGEFPKTSFEWRLPKAPVPSRPDYSRAAPKSDALPGDPRGQVRMEGNRCQTSTTTRRQPAADGLVNVPAVEIAVDDVAFVTESLNHLPNLPSFSFLRQSILAGKSTYIQIVASILLHQKQLRGTDQREAQWAFPGFCTGCKRSGFCYGCSKNPKPHVHEDIPAKVGGGFRFWKRDRPLDPQHWKHPGQWQLPTTEEELRNIIEKYGGLAAYEQAVVRARREMTRRVEEATEDDTDTRQTVNLQRLTNLSTYPPHVTIVSTNDFNKQRRVTATEASQDVTTLTEMAGGQPRDALRKVSIRESRQRSQSAESEMSEESLDRTLIRVDTSYMERVLQDDLNDNEGRKGRQITFKDGAATEQKEAIREDHQVRRRRTTTKDLTDISKSPKKSAQPQTNKGENQPEAETDDSDEEPARITRKKASHKDHVGAIRKDTDYKAPKFFKVQMQSRKITAKDPFSTDRDLNVPKGPGFELKKTDKKVTEFVDFKRGDRGWKAPKKFEIKHKSRTQNAFSSSSAAAGDGAAQENESPEGDPNSVRDLRSPDSGLDSAETVDDSVQVGDNIEETNNQANILKGDEDGQRDEQIEDSVGDASDTVHERQKHRDVVKKSRAGVVTPPKSPPLLPLLPAATNGIITPPVASPPGNVSPILEDPNPLPEIHIPAVPELPDIEDKTSGQGQKKEKIKFLVELPPQPQQAKEAPKKRRAAPKIRSIPKKMYRQRRTRPAEAPVTTEELREIHDPMDFLAKWCIINPDRLPFYELVFEYTIADQTPIYTQATAAEGAAETFQETDTQLSDTDDFEINGKEKKSNRKKRKENADNEDSQELNTQLLPAKRGMSLIKSTMTIEEQHLEKLIFTLDLLHDKMVNLGDTLEDLEAKRLKLLATKARQKVPHIASPNYVPKKTSKGKKKDKQPTQKLKAHEITDEVIVARLDKKVLTELSQCQEMKVLESEIEILQDKVKEVQRRVEHIAREKLLTDAFCMNHYFLRQGIHSQAEDFKRQQSELYNRLHPAQDFEMNLEEVEGALQQINNHLLTKQEVNFLYNILNMPCREKINFRMFTVIAALSEKVTQLDPVIRKMMNNFDYNALDIKMEKCKELFGLLEIEHMPQGAAQAESLAVELTAGGMKPEHTRYVLNKFNRESKGAIDFLDFVIYIPLFVEIHKRIIQDPLKADLDL